MKYKQKVDFTQTFDILNRIFSADYTVITQPSAGRNFYKKVETTVKLLKIHIGSLIQIDQVGEDKFSQLTCCKDRMNSAPFFFVFNHRLDRGKNTLISYAFSKKIILALHGMYLIGFTYIKKLGKFLKRMFHLLFKVYILFRYHFYPSAKIL